MDSLVERYGTSRPRLYSAQPIRKRVVTLVLARIYHVPRIGEQPNARQQSPTDRSLGDRPGIEHCSVCIGRCTDITSHLRCDPAKQIHGRSRIKFSTEQFC